MRRIEYNKAVRDRIPEIIRNEGKTCEVKVLEEEAFINRLLEKLDEEVKEYRQSGAVEELADIVEVVQGLVEHSGLPWEEFERMRAWKRERRGGFRERLFLVAVHEGQATTTVSQPVRPQSAWMVRLSPGGGPGDQVPDGLRSDSIFVGWSPLPQLLEATQDREDFRRLMREVVRAEKGKVDEPLLGKWVGDAWRFIREMQVGDLVVVPHGEYLYIAEVTGDAYYGGTFVHLDTAIRRPVRFANGKRPIPRSFVSPGLRKTLRARQTCIELREHLPEVWSLAGAYVA